MLKRKHVPDSEYKLILLRSLESLGPVTSLQLLQFLVDENLMNYFQMQLNLSEMLENNQICEKRHPLGQLLCMTDDGRYSLDSFRSILSSASDKLIAERAPGWRKRFLLEQSTPA